MTMSIAELADCVSDFKIGTSQKFQVDLSDCGWSFADTLSNTLGDEFLIIAYCDYRLFMAVDDVFIVVHYDRLHAVDVNCVDMCVSWFGKQDDAMAHYFGIR